MHGFRYLIAKMDHHAGTCLSIGEIVLKKVTEAIASSKSASTVSDASSWNFFMEDRERTNTKLVRKLGSRFSAKPQNTIRVLVY
jgi:hypothetical protein